jgi:hypothetical protein
MLRLILSIWLLVVCSIDASADVKTTVPPQAIQYLPYIQSEVELYIPEMTLPWYIPALIEHESCVTLTSPKCWNPSVEFKTAREHGVGLGQLTVAYSANGSVRFDVLEELKSANPYDLSEVNWQNLMRRPDLQIRAIVLLVKRSYSRLGVIKNDYDRIAMTDSAYNGGLGGLYKDRTACGILANCDPQIWFGNVERTCTKSKKVLYANRNACDINRYHVHSVMIDRLGKYRSLK